MKLAFYAKLEHTCRLPGSHGANGVSNFIGFDQVPLPEGGSELRPTKEPFEIDSKDPGAARVKVFCARGALWPANKETAEACGASFVEVKQLEGAWVPAVEVVAKSQPSAKKKKGDD